MDYKRVVQGFILAICCMLVGSASVSADITYWLEPELPAQAAAAVEEAVGLYNHFGSFDKQLTVLYEPSVATADGNYNGTIRFGSNSAYWITRVALHEIGHTLGVGQYWQWNNYMVNNTWTGAYATSQMEVFEGAGATVSGDTQHFWPYGLNEPGEDGSVDRFRHIRMVAALRCDMGIFTFLQEPNHQFVSPGAAASFTAIAPGAGSYAWYKEGNPNPLSNGGDISGATTNTLQIANAETSDEGRYYCVTSGSLYSRPACLRILQMQPRLSGHWSFEDNADDSIGPNHGTVIGSAGYTAGQIGQAINLDGMGEYVILPAGIVNTDDMTIAAWVWWDGGGQWQRIFDFGNGENEYMFLTPRSGGDTLRFAVTVSGYSNEQRIETPQLSTGTWVHVAVTLNGNTGKLYVNGVLEDTNTSMTIDPTDFSVFNNYIGYSQFVADPFFDGRIDDFRIYNYALTDTEVETLVTPSFTNASFSNPDAVELQLYSGHSLTTYVEGQGAETLTFSKDAGPAWLAVEPDGTLSGIPNDGDVGENVFTVRVANSADFYDTATMTIDVANVYSGIRGMEDLAGVAAQWLTADCTDTPACGGADLSGDTNVDATDLNLLAYNWLADESLRLHLPFEEMTGTVTDDASIYALSGSLVNGPTWTDGYSGGGLSFDGADDYVQIPGYKGVTGTSSRTCTAWIQTTMTQTGVILSWGNGQAGQKWTFHVRADGTLGLAVWDGYITSTGIINDGQWHHVAAVLDDDGSPGVNEILLYIDGVPQSTSAGNTQSINTAAGQDAMIGTFENAGVSTSYFEGLIDEVRIYDRALSEADIQKIANP